MKWEHDDWELTQTENARFEFHKTDEACFKSDEIDEARFEFLDADVAPPDLGTMDFRSKERPGFKRVEVVDRYISEAEINPSLRRMFVTMLGIHVVLIGGIVLYDLNQSLGVALAILLLLVVIVVTMFWLGSRMDFVKIWDKTRNSGSVVSSHLAKVSSLCADSPLATLKLFRWFVPRVAREEIDLAISDLRDDRRDLKKQKKSMIFIATVMAWHCIRIIAAYVLDGVFGFLKKAIPVASTFVNRK